MRESLLISCFKRLKKVYKIGHIIKTGYDENKYFIKMLKSTYFLSCPVNHRICFIIRLILLPGSSILVVSCPKKRACQLIQSF